MASIRATRDFFLWCMSVIYLFAFCSLYVQIPGLYGDNGILPARLVLRKAPNTLEEFTEYQPTLLRLMPFIGLDTSTGMDLLCLLGIVVSIVCIVSAPQRDMLGFAILWYLYFSLYQVGQTFLWFQWDILLLEIGFLTVLVAPFNVKIWKWRNIPYDHHDAVTLWLVRWLLFRLMFASGVVKLQSQCPTWWGLTALTYHYETQCIPTPLAWYAHQLPEWFQSLSVVATYVIEIAVPFLFFAPIRCFRIFAGLCQVFLMILIMLTGNYNFFNLLTIVLCIPLMDDNFFGVKHSKHDEDFFENLPVIGRMWKLFKTVAIIGVVVLLSFLSVKCFNLKITDHYTISSSVAFSKMEFQDFVAKTLPLTVWMGAASLSWEILKALGRILSDNSGLFSKSFSLAKCLVISAIAVAMFTISLEPHSAVDLTYRKSLPSFVSQWHANTHEFHLTNSYGLFRRMTGVGGRPEVVVEGSNSLDGGWKEYEFFYKPGNVSRVPPVVAPHQPRLDWQMWFAALGSYQHNPWFLNLVYRMLTGQPEVLELIAHNPFPDDPPKYIKATLYHYYFTKPAGSKWPSNWWRREVVNEYLPALSKNEPSLVNYVKQYNLQQVKPSRKVKVNNLGFVIKTLRGHIGQPEGFNAVMMLFMGCIIIVLPKFLSGR